MDVSWSSLMTIAPSDLLVAHSLYAKMNGEPSEKFCLEMKPTKSTCFVNEEYRGAEWEELQCDIPNSNITIDDVALNTLASFTCKVPIRSVQNIRECSNQKLVKINRGVSTSWSNMPRLSSVIFSECKQWGSTQPHLTDVQCNQLVFLVFGLFF